MIGNVTAPPKGPPPDQSPCFIKGLKPNIEKTLLSSITHETIYQRPYSHEHVPSSRVEPTHTNYARTSLLSSSSSNRNSYLSKVKTHENNYQKLANPKFDLDNQPSFTNHYHSSDVNNLNSVGNVHLIKNPLLVSSIQSSLPSLNTSNLNNENLVKYSQSKLESCQSLEREEQCFQSDLQNCDNLINQNKLRDDLQDSLASRSSFRMYPVDQSSGSDYDQISELDEERFVQSLLARRANSKSLKPDQVFKYNSHSYQEGASKYHASFAADCKKNYSRMSRAKNKRSSQSGHQLIRFKPATDDDYLD